MSHDPDQRAAAHYPFPLASEAAHILRSTLLPQELAQSVHDLSDTPVITFRLDTFGDLLTYLRELGRGQMEEEIGGVAPNIGSLVDTARLDAVLEKLSKQQPVDRDELEILQLEPNLEDPQGDPQLKYDPVGSTQRRLEEERQILLEGNLEPWTDDTEEEWRANNVPESLIGAYKRIHEENPEQMAEWTPGSNQ